MFKMLVSNVPALVAKIVHSFFDIDRVPDSDGRYHKIECASTILLVAQTAVMNAPQAMNANGTR